MTAAQRRWHWRVWRVLLPLVATGLVAALSAAGRVAP
jgi:hypothetical protein